MLREDKRLDKGALNGLRGLCSLHVLAFHACAFFNGDLIPVVYLYAEAAIPIFKLLSGFSLALGYGKTKWSGCTRGFFGCMTLSDDGVDRAKPQEEPKYFDSWAFYKKRFARILPLQYLGIILVLVVTFYG